MATATKKYVFTPSLSGEFTSLAEFLKPLSAELSNGNTLLSVYIQTKCDELSGKLDKKISDIGELLSAFEDCVSLSGDNVLCGSNTFKGPVNFEGNDLCILQGNFVQTTGGEYVKCYSGSNAFVQAECSEKYYNRYGIAAAGALGYCILGIPAANKLKLSGDISLLQAKFAAKPATKYSISLDSTAKSQAYTIAGLTAETSCGYVETNETFSFTSLSSKSEEWFIDLWNTKDDNAFYCPEFPDCGNSRVPSFYGNHIEGAATKALQRCTHAEGRNTISDIRYSHSEGSDTVAGGMYSHAENNSAKAYGDGSHAEGNATSAIGSYTHTEGIGTIALNDGEHASGKYNNSIKGTTLFTVGNGSSASSRKNAFEVDSSGSTKISSDLQVGTSVQVGTTLQVGGDVHFNSSNGSKGLYIGNTTLSDIIESQVSGKVKPTDLSDFYTKGESDGRFIHISGDTDIQSLGISGDLSVSNDVLINGRSVGEMINSEISDKAELEIDGGKARKLEFHHVSYDEYAAIVSSRIILSNECYLISGDGYCDAYGERIINLAMPISANDAVPKAYLSSYYTKSETSSAIQLGNTLGSITSDLKTDHEFLVAATNAVGSMFVKSDLTYYVRADESILKFTSLADALSSLPTYTGYVYVAEDINTISSFTGLSTGAAFNIERALVLDLNGHKVDVDAGTFMTLSSNSVLGRLPDITIRNGKITSNVPGPKFTLYHGSVKFENVDVEVDCSLDTTSTSKMRILRFNGTEDTLFVKKQFASIDKDSSFRMVNANNGQGMNALFTPYFRLVVNKGYLTKEQYNEQFGDMEEELAPEFVIDGKCEVTYSETVMTPTLPYYDGDFEPIIAYPKFIDTNGSDIKKSKLTLNENAFLSIKNGVGIYSGSDINITLNGGTIIAGTGIVLRGGKLIVPANAHPTVIGTHDYYRYLPYHTLVRRSDGQTGSDAETFLNLGHAVILENNGVDSYGGHGVEADIKSGKFISYHNTPIASYSIATTADTGSVSRVLHYNNTDTTCYFHTRVESFVEGGELNKIPTDLPYDYATGHYADKNVLKVNNYSAVAPTIDSLSSRFLLNSRDQVLSGALSSSGDITTSGGISSDEDISTKKSLRAVENIYLGDRELSSIIDSQIAGKSELSIDGEKTVEMNFYHVSYDEYADKLSVEGTILSNDCYFLSGDGYSDAFGERIQNVGMPVKDGDAVPKGYLSSYYTKDQTFSSTEALNNFVSLTGDQVISGTKTFENGLDIGDYIEDVGNNCLGVGNDLIVGSYNFFYKGIDLSSDGKAKIYLTTEQPRFPFPFVKFDGALSSFKIHGNVVDFNDDSTFANLSSFKPAIWNCTMNCSHEACINDEANHCWREDYNQLCIDLGDGYQTLSLDELKNTLSNYLDEAFVGDVDVDMYLEDQELVGQIITMVNGDKIAYLRCGRVLEVIDNNTLLVDFKDPALGEAGYSSLTASGYKGFSDFDYDDASLVFIDKPLLVGPSKQSTYSSLNVGVANRVLRRGAIACGKQLSSEADFAMVFGRRGIGKHYATFLWAPATSIITTDKSGTFNIGLNKPFSQATASNYDSDIRIIDSSNSRMRLWKYIWACMSSDNGFQREVKDWLGIS